jgi:predicted Fe-Mo cluster-binding NifX family protein
MKNNIKIGITSQNFKSISGHAGKSRNFILFEFNAGDEFVEKQRLDLPKEKSMHEFRGENHPPYELDLLITGGCGNGFMQRMQSHDVKVIATGETSIPVAVQSVAQGVALLPAVAHRHT